MASPPTAGLVELDRDRCDELLRTAYMGRLAYVADGRPRIVPMNYRYAAGQVVLRTGDGGKLAHLTDGVPVAFEIDGIDDTYHSGWSVVIEGTAREVVSASEVDELRALALRPWPSDDQEHWIVIQPETVSGRAFGVFLAWDLRPGTA